MPTTTTSSPPSGTTTPKPLASFVRLNRQVALYKPARSLEAASSLAPNTIILCSWMNASSKHIDYYARNYMSLYPSAQIIVITITTKQFIFESEAKRRADITEAVHAILAPNHDKDRILVHSFSNGGGKRSYNVAGVYQSLTGKIFAPQTIIFDSAPGMPQYRRDVHSISVPAKKMSFFPWLLFMTATCSLAAILNFSVYYMPLGFWYNLVWGPMLGLKNPEVLDVNTFMGFIYSKEDLAIDWEDVEKWAKSAHDNGYSVEKKLVLGAEHVQMFKGKGGEQAYWDFVQRMWDLGTGVVAK
jgi:hypothetical protein